MSLVYYTGAVVGTATTFGVNDLYSKLGET
jgi:hypothetical protein